MHCLKSAFKVEIGNQWNESLWSLVLELVKEASINESIDVFKKWFVICDMPRTVVFSSIYLP
jgi:hypothetical protein